MEGESWTLMERYVLGGGWVEIEVESEVQMTFKNLLIFVWKQSIKNQSFAKIKLY